MNDLYFEKSYFCSESISHFSLNKLSDYISEKIVEAYHNADQNSLVICDVIFVKQKIYIIGEIASKTDIDIKKIVKDIINKYKVFNSSLASIEYEIVINIKKLKEIKFNNYNTNDYSIVYGFAIGESNEFMPIPYSISQKISKCLSEYITNNNKIIKGFKNVKVIISQITNNNIKIDKIIFDLDYDMTFENEIIIEILSEDIIKKVVSHKYLDSNLKIFLCNSQHKNINYEFIRAINNNYILIDSYGGNCSFTNEKIFGRSPLMIDKCGSFLARYIVKNIVATGLIDKLEIQLIYSKYSSYPEEICINSFGKIFDSGSINSKDIIEMIKDLFPLSAIAICEYFKLNECSLSEFVNYGLFMNKNAPWEKLDKVNEIKKYFTNKKGIIFLPNKIRK